jgi:hypothetical protein
LSSLKSRQFGNFFHGTLNPKFRQYENLEILSSHLSVLEGSMPDIRDGISMGRKRLPKIINPKLHAILDYTAAATCFTMAALYWRKHKPAAITSLALGVAHTTNNLLTDYPGGAWPVMTLETHDRVSAGVAAMTATLPRAVGFSGDAQARFFRMQAIGQAVVLSMAETGLGSDLRPNRERESVSERAAKFRREATAQHDWSRST